MEELIANIAGRMGIDEAVVRKAISVIMSLIQSEGDDGPVAALFDKLPGASDLAAQGASALEENSDSGGLLGKLGGMMGGGAGTLMNAVSTLQADGLDTSQIQELGSQVFDYAKEEGGEDLVRAVTDSISIPGLSKLL